jgi:hypothetical protein
MGSLRRLDTRLDDEMSERMSQRCPNGLSFGHTMSKRRGWRGRATTPSGQGRYVDVPPGVGTLAEAQAWAEGWLGMQCIAGAAETRV